MSSAMLRMFPEEKNSPEGEKDREENDERPENDHQEGTLEPEESLRELTGKRKWMALARGTSVRTCAHALSLPSVVSPVIARRSSSTSVSDVGLVSTVCP